MDAGGSVGQQLEAQGTQQSLGKKECGWKVSFFALVLLILCAFGIFFVIRFVRWSDQTTMRVDVLELKNRVVELERIRTTHEQAFNAVGQRLENIAINHNKLVQAIEGVTSQHNARIETLEKKAKEVTKPEAEKPIDGKEVKKE